MDKVRSLLKLGREPPVIASTQQGQVEGFRDKATGVLHFRGIPYAAPPVGALRFKKPQPHPAWAGVKACKEFGKMAVQGMSLVALVFMPKVLAALAYGVIWAVGWNPLDNLDPRKPHALPRACSEAECLNLNVETTGLEGKKKPVMVFVHGGAFYLVRWAGAGGWDGWVGGWGVGAGRLVGWLVEWLSG